MTDFEQEFAPLLVKLSDTNAEFHGSTMLQALKSLEVLVPPNSAEAARLYREIAVLQAKRHELDAFDYADMALEANSATAILPQDRLYWMHVACAQIDVYNDSDVLRQVNHINAALLLVNSFAARPMDVLRLRQDLGNLLEALGRHEEALASNMALLADAESLLGADAWDLHYLLSHIAQNFCGLGQTGEALQWLNRRLRVLEIAGDESRVFDTYGIIADLHFNAGDFGKAKAAHADRLAIAERNAKNAWVELASEDFGKHFDADGKPIPQKEKSTP